MEIPESEVSQLVKSINRDVQNPSNEERRNNTIKNRERRIISPNNLKLYQKLDKIKHIAPGRARVADLLVKASFVDGHEYIPDDIELWVDSCLNLEIFKNYLNECQAKRKMSRDNVAEDLFNMLDAYL